MKQFKVGFKSDPDKETIEAENSLAALLLFCQKNELNFLKFRNLISANLMDGGSRPVAQQNKTMEETKQTDLERHLAERETLEEELKNRDDIKANYSEMINEISKKKDVPVDFFKSMEKNNMSPGKLAEMGGEERKTTSFLLEQKDLLKKARLEREENENKIAVLKQMTGQSNIDLYNFSEMERKLNPQQYKEFFQRFMDRGVKDEE